VRTSIGVYRLYADESVMYVGRSVGTCTAGSVGDPDGVGARRRVVGGAGVTACRYLFHAHHGGGWTLVAANAASDSTIPAGTGRNSASYTIAAAIRGTPNPANDYTIGAMVDAISFTEARISGDRASQTERVDFKFPCTSRACTTNSGSSGVITDLNSANVTFYAYLQYSPPLVCTLDAVARDVGFNANSQQSTVGGACVGGSIGDPSDGCYVGHGAGEGSFEGWYDDFPSGGYTNQDADRYATWVR
jgi:hypothetical protein